MPKMKHLLRKLHIGGGCDNSNHHPSPPQTAEVTPPLSSSSASLESALMRIRAVESAENSVDFNFFEEEFQVQLALAISVSDPDSREDPETVQIKDAKQISLGCVPSETLTESLSLILGCLLEDDSSWCNGADSDPIHPSKSVDCKLAHLSDEVFDSRILIAPAFVQKLFAEASTDSARCPYLANLEIERRKFLFGKGDDDKLIEALMQYFFSRPEVRESAGLAFSTLYKALEDDETSDTALDGLKQILKAFTAHALGALAEVAGPGLDFHREWVVSRLSALG